MKKKNRQSKNLANLANIARNVILVHPDKHFQLPSAPELKTFLIQIAQGDQKEFFAGIPIWAFRWVKNKIASYCYRHPRFAQEIFQDFICHTFEQFTPERLAKVRSPSAYFKTVVKNRCCKWYEKYIVKQPQMMDSLDPVKVGYYLVDDFSVEEDINNKEFLAEVDKILKNPRHTWFIIMYLKGYSREELADYFDTSVDQVRKTYHYILKKLRKQKERFNPFLP